MRLSNSVAAGAALCVAAAASADVVTTQTFEINPSDGGFVFADSPLSNQILRPIYGKPDGYLHRGWNRSYQPFRGAASDLIQVDLKITVDVGRVGSLLPMGGRFQFYTGDDSNPLFQFTLTQKNFTTDANGKWTYNKAFTRSGNPSELALWANSPSASAGTFYSELYSQYSFFGKLSAELTITSTPGPGGALAMTVFAMGGLARRRRAA
jgi:hypothetical protein